MKEKAYYAALKDKESQKEGLNLVQVLMLPHSSLGQREDYIYINKKYNKIKI